MIEKIPYLVSLGVKQLELMPIYEFEEFPRPKKKTNMYEREVPQEDLKLNYWGYTSGFYFAPKASYAAGKDASKELKDLVKALHKAGIELILEFYFDETAAPHMVMDCLKYLVEEYHIDGIHINRSALPMRNLVMDPSLKSTPREACAFKILSVSLNKVGINLSAIEIIIARIDGFNFNNSNGFKNHSIAFARSIGFVVRVSVVDTRIITNTLATINVPIYIPPSWIFTVEEKNDSNPIVSVSIYIDNTTKHIRINNLAGKYFLNTKNNTRIAATIKILIIIPINKP